MIKNILNLGDAALYCDFGQDVNKKINSNVIKYYNKIRKLNIKSINNITPSYNKLIISFDEYTQIVEKLAIQIHKNYKPTVLVGIMRGAAPILDILSRILKLPIAYIVIQSYSGEGMEDKQGQLMFAREISSLANDKDFNKVLLIDDLSDTGLTLNKSIEWLKNYGPTKNFINEVKTACLWKKNHQHLNQIFVQ